MRASVSITASADHVRSSKRDDREAAAVDRDRRAQLDVVEHRASPRSRAARRLRWGRRCAPGPSSSTMPVNIRTADLVVEAHVGTELPHRRELEALRRRRSSSGPANASAGSAAGTEHERRDVHDEPLRVTRRPARCPAACRRLRRAPAARLRGRAARASRRDRHPRRRRRAPRPRPSRRPPATRRSRRAPIRSVVTTSVGASVGVEERTDRRDAARARRAARASADGRGTSATSRTVSDGTIGERGAAPDHDRLRVGAQLVRVGAGELRGEPARRTVGRRDPAVDARRDLGDHERPAGAAVMEIRREIARRPLGTDTDGHVDTGGAQPREARRRRRADRDLRARRRRG